MCICVLCVCVLYERCEICCSLPDQTFHRFRVSKFTCGGIISSSDRLYLPKIVKNVWSGCFLSRSLYLKEKIWWTELLDRSDSVASRLGFLFNVVGKHSRSVHSIFYIPTFKHSARSQVEAKSSFFDEKHNRIRWQKNQTVWSGCSEPLKQPLNVFPWFGHKLKQQYPAVIIRMKHQWII